VGGRSAPHLAKTELGWGPEGLAGAQRRLVYVNVTSNHYTFMFCLKNRDSSSCLVTLHLDVSRDEVGRYNILSRFYYVRKYVRYLLMYVFSRQKYPFSARKGPFSPRVSSRNSRLEILILEHLISVQSQISRNVRDENETHLYA
jgi:hypothetical protein